MELLIRCYSSASHSNCIKAKDEKDASSLSSEEKEHDDVIVAIFSLLRCLSPSLVLFRFPTEKESAKLRKDKQSSVIWQARCVSLASSTWREKRARMFLELSEGWRLSRESSDVVPQSLAIEKRRNQDQCWLLATTIPTNINIDTYKSILLGLLSLDVEALKNADFLFYWHYQEQWWK